MKSTKAEAGYRDQPNGKSRCGNCSMFSAPYACIEVSGRVRSNGWCKLWAAAKTEPPHRLDKAITDAMARNAR